MNDNLPDFETPPKDLDLPEWRPAVSPVSFERR